MNIRRWFLVCCVLILPQSGWSAERVDHAVKPVRNVIVMIPDGMSVGSTTLARWFQGGTPLALDEMACGLVRTYNSDTPIGDSAPAGSAYATGYKSQGGQIASLPVKAGMPGVRPTPVGDENRPVATVLEAARLAGKSTGLVATSEIMHATPADFSAHDPSRKSYDNLSKQQVHNRIDVVFGGGAKFMKPEQRQDSEDMLAVLKGLGYAVVTTSSEMAVHKGGKVWGLFAPADLKYDLDRDPLREPSLAEMTTKAITLLAQNPKGFFLMVEGSKVDWAAHANDPTGIVSDVLAFDKAVKTALDFAKADGSTVVLAMADHGNSGLSMGDMSTSQDYYKVPLSTFIDPLKKAKVTGEELGARLNADRSNVKSLFASLWGIEDLADGEVAAMVHARDQISGVAGSIISRRARIGFTTHGHTGEDVVFYAWSPNRDHPTGVIENSAVASLIARYLDVNLAKTTSTLFVEASADFAARGAMVRVDSSDRKGLELVVQKGEVEVRFPRNKNYATRNGAKVELPGVTVFNGAKWYLSQAGIALIP